MKENIYISGFADEISPDFTEQLKTVTSLGMHYISLRSADGKNIAEYTPDEVREKLMPRLAQYGVKVSSIGSPVGKVGVEDEAGFAEHLAGLERLCEICKLLDCRYIRMFSFFIPHGKDPDSYRDVVIEKLRKFAAVAEKHDVILLHENEKDIYAGSFLKRWPARISARHSTLRILCSAARIRKSAGSCCAPILSISISRMPSLTTRRMCCAAQAKARSRHCSPAPSATKATRDS